MPKQQQQLDGIGVGAMGSCQFLQSAAMGYAAPELAYSSLRMNEKCDVYGFGVLVLELVMGRRAVEYGEDDVAVLTDQVRVALEQGAGVDDDGAAAERLVHPALRGEFPEEEALPVLKLGVVCTSQIPSNRPSMADHHHPAGHQGPLAARMHGATFLTRERTYELDRRPARAPLIGMQPYVACPCMHRSASSTCRRALMLSNVCVRVTCLLVKINQLLLRSRHAPLVYSVTCAFFLVLLASLLDVKMSVMRGIIFLLFESDVAS
jgi:hypothetical protein